MRTVVCSLQSHFLKHLLCTSVTAANFSRRRLRRRRTQPWISFFLSAPLLTRKYQSRLITATAEVSTTTSSSSSFPPSETQSADSFNSEYLSVRICCKKDIADTLSEALLCFGASSTTVDGGDEDKDKNEVFVDSIFDVSQDVKQNIFLATDSIGLKEIPSYEIVQHSHFDWIKATQESFQPAKIREGLWIVPEWIPVPDPQATNIILNPGLAFGTGEHATTKLCLMLLHDIIKGGESFLDYGTGSGILGIAAIKFGAALSVGFDIEPQAITAAQYNASLNNIGPEKFITQIVPESNSLPSMNAEISTPIDNDTNVLDERDKYDVVVANILLNPLLELADQIVSYAKTGAIVALSGIITEQIPCILKRYSELLDDITVSQIDDWACIKGFKKRT